MTLDHREIKADQSFEMVQVLRDLNDDVLFSKGCCVGDLGVIKGLLNLTSLSKIDGAQDRGVADEVSSPVEPYLDVNYLRSQASKFQEFIESSETLQGRIRNAIDLVSPVHGSFLAEADRS